MAEAEQTAVIPTASVTAGDPFGYGAHSCAFRRSNNPSPMLSNVIFNLQELPFGFSACISTFGFENVINRYNSSTS